MAVLEKAPRLRVAGRRGFTVGIGSATAIYAVIHSLLLKPLPYAHGERFVSVLEGRFKDPDPLSGF